MMVIRWDDWQKHFKRCPIIKVDGKTIRNVVTADEENRKVTYIKGRKQLAATGNVEIIGERL